MQQGQLASLQYRIFGPVEERTDELATESHFIVEKIETLSHLNSPEGNRRSGEDRRQFDERRQTRERCEDTERRTSRDFDRREPVEAKLLGLSHELQEILNESAALHDMLRPPR